MTVKLFYSAPEAAKLAGWHPETMRRYGKLGLVPGYKLIGKRYVFMCDEFDLWLEKQQEQEAA